MDGFACTRGPSVVPRVASCIASCVRHIWPPAVGAVPFSVGAREASEETVLVGPYLDLAVVAARGKHARVGRVPGHCVASRLVAASVRHWLVEYPGTSVVPSASSPCASLPGLSP